MVRFELGCANRNCKGLRSWLGVRNVLRPSVTPTYDYLVSQKQVKGSQFWVLGVLYRGSGCIPPVHHKYDSCCPVCLVKKPLFYFTYSLKLCKQQSVSVASPSATFGRMSETEGRMPVASRVKGRWKIPEVVIQPNIFSFWKCMIYMVIYLHLVQ